MSKVSSDPNGALTPYIKIAFSKKFTDALSSARITDEALAMEFFERYLNEVGGEYKLTNAQLVKLIGETEKPNIPVDIRYDSIFDIPRFSQSYTNLIQAGGIGQYDGQVLWQIFNGTLGRYVLSYKGTLCCPNPNRCSWRGTVKLENENWDFDPDWGWPPPTGGRTAGGERDVRRAYVADVGKPFHISGEAPILMEFSRGGKSVVHDATGISGGF